MVYENDNGAGMDESAFNSAEATNYRLSRSWFMIGQHFRDGNYTDYNKELEILWIEFVADTTPEVRKKKKLIDQLFVKAKKQKSLAKIWKVLKAKTYFMKGVEKGQGLGKKYKDYESEGLFS